MALTGEARPGAVARGLVLRYDPNPAQTHLARPWAGRAPDVWPSQATSGVLA